MSRPAVARKYGKKSTRTKAERLFAELPQSPIRNSATESEQHDVDEVAQKIKDIKIDDEKPLRRSPRKSTKIDDIAIKVKTDDEDNTKAVELPEIATLSLKKNGKSTKTLGFPDVRTLTLDETAKSELGHKQPEAGETGEDEPSLLDDDCLHHMSWEELCPVGDKIVKIAEASYAEVYRITNDQGTSIIKVIRLESPIRPQTKTQVKAGLIDEEPRSEADVQGELHISELLAGVPGFVIYKERYVVQGKATKHLLETHQTFQRRMKRQDPGRAQFYPSPSRYLDETKFLVVELGDAGSALEDCKVETESQLWDIFFLEALALARAEIESHFEVSFITHISIPGLTDLSIATYTKETYVLGRSLLHERDLPEQTHTSVGRVLTSQSWTMGCREQKTFLLILPNQLLSTSKRISACSPARMRRNAKYTGKCDRVFLEKRENAFHLNGTPRRTTRASLKRHFRGSYMSPTPMSFGWPTYTNISSRTLPATRKK